MSDKWITKIEVIDSEGSRMIYLSEFGNKYYTPVVVADGTVLKLYETVNYKRNSLYDEYRENLKNYFIVRLEVIVNRLKNGESVDPNSIYLILDELAKDWETQHDNKELTNGEPKLNNDLIWGKWKNE